MISHVLNKKICNTAFNIHVTTVLAHNDKGITILDVLYVTNSICALAV